LADAPVDLAGEVVALHEVVVEPDRVAVAFEDLGEVDRRQPAALRGCAKAVKRRLGRVGAKNSSGGLKQRKAPQAAHHGKFRNGKREILMSRARGFLQNFWRFGSISVFQKTF
jgi:hypothetical protein